MISENQTNPSLNNKSPNFVDKLISFRGLLKIVLFFSIQVSVLAYQMSHLFYVGFVLTNDNYWNYNISILIQIIINYVGFLAILLFIFAFYLGKELKLRNKERFVLFSFKGFLFGAIFLVLNGYFIYYSLYYYYFAQMGYAFFIEPNEFFVNVPFFIMLYIWIFIGIFYFIAKVFSFFVAIITRKPSIPPATQPSINVSQQPAQSNQISTTTTQQIHQSPVIPQVQQMPVFVNQTQQPPIQPSVNNNFAVNQPSAVS